MCCIVRIGAQRRVNHVVWQSSVVPFVKLVVIQNATKMQEQEEASQIMLGC